MNVQHIFSRQGGYGPLRCSLCGISPWDSDPFVGCEVKMRRLNCKGMSNSNPVPLSSAIPSVLANLGGERQW